MSQQNMNTPTSGSAPYSLTTNFDNAQNNFTQLYSRVFTNKESDVILAGDSLMAYSSKNLSITSITSSAGIATVTTSSVHNSKVNEQVEIVGTFTPFYFGTKTVIDVPSTTTFTFAIDLTAAASATASAGTSGMQINYTSTASFSGMFPWMNAKLGGKLNLLVNRGCVGAGVDYIALECDNIIANYSPCNLIINSGINSITASVAVDTIYSALKAALVKLVNAGFTVFYINTTPLGSGNASNASHYGRIVALNNRLERFISTNTYIHLIDAYKVVVDKTSLVGAAQSSLLISDGLHWSVAGSRIIGEDAATVCDVINPTLVDVASKSASDIFVTGQNTDSILSNPFFFNTAGTGTVANGATMDPVAGVGSGVADGYTLYRLSSNGTVVGTIEADTNGFGNRQVITVVTTANGDGALLYVPTSLNYYTRLVAGQKYRLVVAIDIESPVNLSSIILSPTITIGSAQSFTQLEQSKYTSSGTTIGASNFSGILATPIRTLRAGTITALQINLSFTFSGAGGAVIKIGRLQLQTEEDW